LLFFFDTRALSFSFNSTIFSSRPIAIFLKLSSSAIFFQFFFYLFSLGDIPNSRLKDHPLAQLPPRQEHRSRELVAVEPLMRPFEEAKNLGSTGRVSSAWLRSNRYPY